MKLGIIGAMDVEVASIKEKIHMTAKREVANMEFVEGTIGKLTCVVVKCGVGKVNAAMCVQILADLFSVTHIVNTGVAGSLNQNLHIGDILIVDQAVHHDVDATNFGYALGEVPGLSLKAFDSDRELSKYAETAVKQAAPDVQVLHGTAASGDIFVRTKEKKEWIREKFHADCCEMESAAIAQACTLNRIPFVIIRAISDQADESTAVSYDIFEREAAIHCANAVFHLVATLNS